MGDQLTGIGSEEVIHKARNVGCQDDEVSTQLFTSICQFFVEIRHGIITVHGHMVKIYFVFCRF